MPIYEYKCTKCEHIEAVMQKISDPAPDVCPQCSAKDSMQKIMSRTNFQLKGNGWYVTDFRDKDKKPQKPESSSESSDAVASDSTVSKPDSAASDSQKSKSSPAKQESASGQSSTKPAAKKPTKAASNPK
mgnify:CR=1 FL=1